MWGCGDKEGRLPEALEEDSGAAQVTRAYCFTSRAARIGPGLGGEAGTGAGATAAQSGNALAAPSRRPPSLDLFPSTAPTERSNA